MAKGMSPLRLFMRGGSRKTGPDCTNGGSSGGVDGISATALAQARQPLCPITDTKTNPVPSVMEQSRGAPSTPRGKSELPTPRSKGKNSAHGHEEFPHLENSEDHGNSINVTPEKHAGATVKSSGVAPLAGKSRFTGQHRHCVTAPTSPFDVPQDLTTPPRPIKQSLCSDVGQGPGLCGIGAGTQQSLSNNSRVNSGGSVPSTPKSLRSTGARYVNESDSSGSQAQNTTPSRGVSRSLKYGHQPTSNSSGTSVFSSVRPTLVRPTGYLQTVKGGFPHQVHRPFEEPRFQLEEDSTFWRDHNVQVIIRTRPINAGELGTQGWSRCLKQENPHTVSWLGQPESRFTFDHVAGETITQANLFEVAGLPMVENCMSGYNSCMFAYGQTGSGKTHTMLGDIEDLEHSPSENRGITPRVFEYLFGKIRTEQEARRQENLRFFCRCSFLEIYNEQITDLLEPLSTNLQLREDSRKGVYVENLSEVEVQNVQDVIRLLLQGAATRKVAATNMNRESSRSHSVFTCVVESKWESNSMTNSRYGRLHLVDLAGSERQKSSGAEGGRLKEAANINKSLSTLGLVIMILVDVANGKQRHVPYRDSKLTFFLQDSLGGNSKTIMIANVSPSSCCAMETLSTLKFAQRAKFIRNNAVINEDASGDVVALRQQIDKLKGEVDRLRRESIPRTPSSRHLMVQLESGETENGGHSLWKSTSIEAVLAGALRREQAADDTAKNLSAEIEQLNRLVRQREEDSQCSKMMLRFREEKIRRLESVADNMLPGEVFHDKERTSLIEELQMIRCRIDRNPEVTRFAMENIRLMEQLRRYQDFYDCGERDVMLEEISGLRHQLLDALASVNGGEALGNLSSSQKRAPEITGIGRENELLLIEVDGYRRELRDCRDNLNSCIVANAELARQIDGLQAELSKLQGQDQKQKAKEPELRKQLKEAEDLIQKLSSEMAGAKLPREADQARCTQPRVVSENEPRSKEWDAVSSEIIQPRWERFQEIEMRHSEEIARLHLELESTERVLNEERRHRLGAEERSEDLSGRLRAVLSELDQKQVLMEGLEARQMFSIEEIENLQVKYEKLLLSLKQQDEDKIATPARIQDCMSVDDTDILKQQLQKARRGREEARMMTRKFQEERSLQIALEKEREETISEVETQAALAITALQVEILELKEEASAAAESEAEAKLQILHLTKIVKAHAEHSSMLDQADQYEGPVPQLRDLDVRKDSEAEHNRNHIVHLPNSNQVREAERKSMAAFLMVGKLLENVTDLKEQLLTCHTAFAVKETALDSLQQNLEQNRREFDEISVRYQMLVNMHENLQRAHSKLSEDMSMAENGARLCRVNERKAMAGIVIVDQLVVKQKELKAQNVRFEEEIQEAKTTMVLKDAELSGLQRQAEEDGQKHVELLERHQRLLDLHERLKDVHERLLGDIALAGADRERMIHLAEIKAMVAFVTLEHVLEGKKELEAANVRLVQETEEMRTARTQSVAASASLERQLDQEILKLAEIVDRHQHLQTLHEGLQQEHKRVQEETERLLEHNSLLIEEGERKNKLSERKSMAAFVMLERIVNDRNDWKAASLRLGSELAQIHNANGQKDKAMAALQQKIEQDGRKYEEIADRQAWLTNAYRGSEDERLSLREEQARILAETASVVADGACQVRLSERKAMAAFLTLTQIAHNAKEIKAANVKLEEDMQEVKGAHCNQEMVAMSLLQQLEEERQMLAKNHASHELLIDAYLKLRDENELLVRQNTSMVEDGKCLVRFLDRKAMAEDHLSKAEEKILQLARIALSWHDVALTEGEQLITSANCVLDAVLTEILQVEAAADRVDFIEKRLRVGQQTVLHLEAGNAANAVEVENLQSEMSKVSTTAGLQEKEIQTWGEEREDYFLALQRERTNREIWAKEKELLLAQKEEAQCETLDKEKTAQGLLVELRTLESRLQEADLKVSEMRNSVQVLTIAKEVLEQERHRLLISAREADKTCIEKERAFFTLQGDFAALQARIIEAEQREQSTSKKMEDIKAGAMQLKHENDILERELKDLKDENRNIQFDEIHLRSEVRKGEIAMFEGLRRSQQVVERIDSGMTGLDSDLAGLEEMKATLEQDMKFLELAACGYVAAVEDKEAEMQTRLRSDESEISEMQVALQRASAEVSIERDKREMDERKVADAYGREKDLSDKVAGLESSKAKLGHEIAQMQSVASTRIVMMKEHEREYVEMQRRVERAELQVSEMRTAMDLSAPEYFPEREADRKKREEGTKAREIELKEEIGTSEFKLSAIQKLLHAAFENVEVLGCRKTELDKEIQGLNNDAAICQSKAAGHQEHIESLKELSRALESDCLDTEEKIIALNDFRKQCVISESSWKSEKLRLSKRLEELHASPVGSETALRTSVAGGHHAADGGPVYDQKSLEDVQQQLFREKLDNQALRANICEKEMTILSARKEMEIAIANLREAELEMDKVHQEKEHLKKSHLENTSISFKLKSAEEELLKRARRIEGCELELQKVAIILSDWDMKMRDVEKEWRLEKAALAQELTEARLAACEKRSEAAVLLQKFKDGQATLKEAEGLVDALVKANEKTKTFAQDLTSEKATARTVQGLDEAGRDKLVSVIRKLEREMRSDNQETWIFCKEALIGTVETMNILNVVEEEVTILKNAHLMDMEHSIREMRILADDVTADLKNLAGLRLELEMLFTMCKDQRRTVVAAHCQHTILPDNILQVGDGSLQRRISGQSGANHDAGLGKHAIQASEVQTGSKFESNEAWIYNRLDGLVKKFEIALEQTSDKRTAEISEDNGGIEAVVRRQFLALDSWIDLILKESAATKAQMHTLRPRVTSLEMEIHQYKFQVENLTNKEIAENERRLEVKQTLASNQEVLISTLATCTTLAVELPNNLFQCEEWVLLREIATMQRALRKSFEEMKEDILRFQMAAKDERQKFILERNVADQWRQQLIVEKRDLLSSIVVLEDELDKKRLAMDNQRAEIFLERGKAAHSLQAINCQMKAIEGDRDKCQAEILVLRSEQIQMEKTLAGERAVRAAEALQVAEAGKILAKENEEDDRIFRRVEELENTIYALENQLDCVTREAEMERVAREGLEREMGYAKDQMAILQANISQNVPTARDLQEAEVSKLELGRVVIEMKNQQMHARQTVESLQQECAEKEVQLRSCRAHIDELMFGAEKQASENQQKLKTLEFMVEQLKTDDRKTNPAAEVSGKGTEKLTTTKVKASGSPFKCIGAGLAQQRTSEMDEELSAANRRIRELEAIAVTRQKEVFMLNTKLAEAESMTHDVVRDLLGVKMDIASYATLLNQQQVQRITERARRRTVEAEEKEEELKTLRKSLNEVIEERESWLEEINRRQAEAVAARVSAEKLRLRDQSLVADNERFQAEHTAMQKKMTELEEEIRKLSGQQNLQQRIHHHAKIKEENKAFRLQNEDLNAKLRRMEILFTRVNDELTWYRTTHGLDAPVNFEEEARLREALQDTEESRLQLAQTLTGLYTSILQAAGVQRTTTHIDLSAAMTALQQLQDRHESLQRELSACKLKAKIAEEQRRLSDLRDLHTPVKMSTNFTTAQDLSSLISSSR